MKRKIIRLSWSVLRKGKGSTRLPEYLKINCRILCLHVWKFIYLLRASLFLRMCMGCYLLSAEKNADQSFTLALSKFKTRSFSPKGWKGLPKEGLKLHQERLIGLGNGIEKGYNLCVKFYAPSVFSSTKAKIGLQSTRTIRADAGQKGFPRECCRLCKGIWFRVYQHSMNNVFGGTKNCKCEWHWRLMMAWW